MAASPRDKRPPERWPTLPAAKAAAQHGAICGLAGASAMFLQVALMMPVDTTITMQYRYGLAPLQAASRLFKEGRLPRFYAGLAPALCLGPLARFGDTASNAATITWLDSAPATANLPMIAKTIMASTLAASWRVVLMPFDVSKTVCQVYGGAGLEQLRSRARSQGVGGFYYGSAAAFTTSFAGHLPWYTTFNELDRRLPFAKTRAQKMARYATLGFSASVVSDSMTNSLRVVKAIRQAEGLSYAAAVHMVVSTQGASGLLTRGLQTRILANGFQSILFTILWKTFEENVHNSPSVHKRRGEKPP
ncbi:mitochondrial carrier domain-containing protein [Pelagophyceae sp. CCMP2097]|nr:mitochondrial carrier domain-containing protein [Pelagophyceae sp. CCMP2097]